MTARSIAMIIVVLALLFTVSLGNLKIYPNNLPNRWDFPAPFEYTALIKESPSITKVTIELTIKRTIDNTQVVLSPNEAIELYCGFWKDQLPIIPAIVKGQNTPTLVIAAKDKFSDSNVLPESQLTVRCERLAIGRPADQNTPHETAAVMVLTITDVELGVIHTDELDLTIHDLPSMSHSYEWGSNSHVGSAEIRVRFDLYLPSTFSSDVGYIDLDHPLLDLNKIDSMHLPHGANRLDDLKRPYNIVNDRFLMNGIPCKITYDTTCATIHFVRSEPTGKLVPRATITNPADPSLCICSFEIPYPPDVLHSILGPSQSKQVQMMVNAPDSQEHVTIATIPIDHPRMIIGKYIYIGYQPYLWYSALQTNNTMTQFELGIATTDRDERLSWETASTKTITFILVKVEFDGDERSYDLEKWSPVMACRQHDTVEYPDEQPLIEGKIDVTLAEFGGFGKTCRIRLLNRPTETRTSWWLRVKTIPFNFHSPTHTIFNPMHQVDERYKYGDTMTLHDIVDDNHQTSIVANANPWKSDMPLLPSSTPHPVGHHDTLQPLSSSSEPFVFSNNPSNPSGMQPIPFARYISEYASTEKHFARATIDIKYLLPYGQPFSAAGMMLAIIFPGRNTIQNGVLPEWSFDWSFFIDTKGIPQSRKLDWKFFSYNFHGVLDQQHSDPIQSVFQNGRPLRVPMIGLHPTDEDRQDIALRFNKDETLRMTIEFAIDATLDIENEPIYIALLSHLDIIAGRFTTQYAHITPPATHQRSAGQIAGIAIGTLIGVGALVSIAIMILWCRRHQRACFRRDDLAKQDINSDVYQQL